MIPEYDRVAWFYDRLARIVFGDKLEQAKKLSLDKLRQGNKILIVGGGSGSLLSHIDELNINCHVDFVDFSQKMLEKARKLHVKHLSVSFFNKDIIQYSGQSYDVIFVNFFFDQYNSLACENYLRHLITLAKPGAYFIYADFIPSKRLLDRIIQHLMYSFFRYTIKLGKVQLVDHRRIFLKHDLVCQRTQTIGSFITADVFKIPDQKRF